MSLTMIIILSVVGCLVLLFFFQRSAFSKMSAAVKGQISKWSKSIWAADPLAVYQAEVDEAAEQVSIATADLSQYVARKEELARKKVQAQNDSETYKARIRQALLDNNENLAAELALKLQEKEKQLVDINKSFENAETTYQNTLKKVKFARKKIEDARENAKKLHGDLEMSKAEAKIADLAQSFNINTNKIDGLGEVTSEIQRQIDQNRARAEVIRDLNADGIDEIEEEERLKKTQAKELLEKYKEELKVKS